MFDPKRATASAAPADERGGRGRRGMWCSVVMLGGDKEAVAVGTGGAHMAGYDWCRWRRRTRPAARRWWWLGFDLQISGERVYL